MPPYEEVRLVANAIEIYHGTYQKYPKSLSDLDLNNKFIIEKYGIYFDDQRGIVYSNTGPYIKVNWLHTFSFGLFGREFELARPASLVETEGGYP